LPGYQHEVNDFFIKRIIHILFSKGGSMKTGSILFLGIIALLVFFSWPDQADAYEEYSGCMSCHGDYLSGSYGSLTNQDPADWNDSLHNVHRRTMLSDCSNCHSGNDRSPVYISLSGSDPSGQGSGLSCVGCHGTAGLRQHHTNAQVGPDNNQETCLDCHGSESPPGEDALPPWYATLEWKPCNADGSETFAGTHGLDNDGDLSYDGNDPDCVAVVPQPDINLDPATLDFGTIFIGDTMVMTAQLQNPGTADLQVSGITLSSGTSNDFTFSPAPPFSVTPDGSQTLTVTYTPGDEGLDSGSLVIESNDPDEPTVDLQLIGTATFAPEPDINLDSTALDFNTVYIGDTAVMTAQVQNLGTADLQVAVISPGPGTSDEFTFLPAGSFSLAPNGSQTLTVTYAPVNEGQDSGSLVIESDDPDEPAIELQLTGAGSVVPRAVIQLNPAALDFGTVMIGNSTSQTTRVENQGTADLVIDLVNRCSGTSDEFSWNPDAPFSVAPGDGQLLTVTYMPVDEGLDNGCLAIVTGNTETGPVELALSGAGTVAPEPDINPDPAMLEFNTVIIGDTAVITAEIQNLGTADLYVSAVNLGAGTSDEFTFSPAGSFSLAPNSSQTLTVTYTPMDEGPDSGSLVIESDDPDEPAVELRLTGTGSVMPQAVINLNPAVLDFGSVMVGDSTSVVTQVENQGTADLEVDLINRCSGTSGEFSWQPDAPFTVPPGNSRRLTVTYMPMDAGTDTGCLAITSNNPHNEPVELGISGTGTEQPMDTVDLDIAGLVVTEEVILSGRRSVKIKLMVKNNGKADAPRKAVVTGMQNGSEVYSENMMVSAPTGSKISRWVFRAFRPQQTGNIAWTATLSDDDSDVDQASAATRVMKKRSGKETVEAYRVVGEDDHTEEEDDHEEYDGED
jgi:hypothetical protein